MKILWFTTRNMTDLCSTTQSSLGEGLVSRGHQVIFINSDKKGSHAEYSWSHVPIQSQAIRGRKTQVLGKKMRQWLSHFESSDQTVAIVDWGIASCLSPMLKEKAIPWILMDRSPPADTGILGRLQWPMWKKAWKLVRDKNAHSGCVVSSAHVDFVHSRTGTLLENMVILPAGVDVSLFKPGIKNEILTLTYHGRLDRHRGILSLPMLLEKLRQNEIKAKLVLIGEGDAFEGLARMAEDRSDMEVIAPLPSHEVAAKLACSHIGLLPMPKTKVWALASPLKRSEYAASGLLIFGIDHLGHRLREEIQPSWIHLVHQENFHLDGVKWIQSLVPENIQSLSKESRRYAVQNLDWEYSVEKLEHACLSSLT